jgi:hypothetical protein
LPSHPDHKYIWFRVGSIITLLFRATSKFRLIYCFFLVKSWVFFIEKVHILRITHFSSHPDHKYIWFRVGISVVFFRTDSPAGWCWAPGIKKCWMHNFTLASPPIPNIFMIRVTVTRQIKCIIPQAPGSYPTPYLKWTF